jgi:PAS domain S-box-containing protein
MSARDSLRWLNHRLVANYGVPLLSVGAALIISRWLDLYLTRAPVSLFICAVMFSAWFGGFRPGLLATVLSLVAFRYFFIPPIHSLALEITEIPRLIVFLFAAFFVASLSAGQRSAAEALRESEQRFRDYAETASDWIWESGPDHSFTRVPEKIIRLGIEPRSRIGRMRWDFATDVEEEPEKWRRHRATLEAHQPFRDFRYRVAGADGAALYVAASGKPVFDAGGRFLGYRGVSSDVTAEVHADQVENELHQAQAELARVIRVTTLGELAASIAHEINQPLAAIGADASACLHWLAADRPDLDGVREALDAIVQDSHRAGAVIARIRTLLARSPVAHEPCDLIAIIREVLTLVGPETGRHGILLETSVAPDLPQVMGDRIQLQQVLLNLLLNAAEAMREVPPARRRLVVRAIVDQHDDGPWAAVTVKDAGVGFDEAASAHLFEPFFTTKPGGLGMGLSISRSIVDSHSGRLWATANPDHGATFHLALPGVR